VVEALAWLALAIVDGLSQAAGWWWRKIRFKGDEEDDGHS
jgi:hypothetical protein